MPVPEATYTDFEAYSGITLTEAERTRVTVLLGRASRHLRAELDLPEEMDADQEATWLDGVSQLAHLYWEAEKANVMEILALPVSQLSLGTLFWTKEANTNFGGMWALNRLLGLFGNVKRLRFALEGELDYPE